jgi:hypothetical protein
MQLSGIHHLTAVSVDAPGAPRCGRGLIALLVGGSSRG